MKCSSYLQKVISKKMSRLFFLFCLILTENEGHSVWLCGFFKAQGGIYQLKKKKKSRSLQRVSLVNIISLSQHPKKGQSEQLFLFFIFQLQGIISTLQISGTSNILVLKWILLTYLYLGKQCNVCLTFMCFKCFLYVV